MDIVFKFSDFDLTKSYTFADYVKWQFQERAELIRGFVAKNSRAANLIQQTILYNSIISFLKNFAGKLCCTIFGPFDVRLPIESAKNDTTVVQPDIFVVCDLSKLNNSGSIGAPDLKVKITAPHNTKDGSITKFNLYQEARE